MEAMRKLSVSISNHFSLLAVEGDEKDIPVDLDKLHQKIHKRVLGGSKCEPQLYLKVSFIFVLVLILCTNNFPLIFLQVGFCLTRMHSELLFSSAYNLSLEHSEGMHSLWSFPLFVPSQLLKVKCRYFYLDWRTT